MSQYLLDSGPLSAYLLGRELAVNQIRPWISQGEAATSLLVYGEIIEYLKSLPDFPRRAAELRILLRAVHPHSLNYSILDRYADIRRSLRTPHGPGLIGDIDSLIAATALEHDLIVVTGDTDFQRVPGLRVKLLSPRL